MSKLLIISRLHGRQCQRGVVLPLLAVGMLAIIGIIGVSVDVGHLFLNKTRLQNSLDSAALSGARTLMLSNDISAASADARAVFSEHLDGEMGSLDASNLILQYSNTLVPFVADGGSPRFVRAVYQSFTTSLTFSSLLPNVGESMSIAGSAVAGPIPVGYPTGGKTCDIAPLLICEIPQVSECSDGGCVDNRVASQENLTFTLWPGTDILSSEEQSIENNALQPSTCGDESAENLCESALDDEGDVHYFLVNYLGCADNTCLRNNLAGSFNSCLTQDSTVAIEESATLTPILQGLMTRFGNYHSSLSTVNYPPDVVVDQNFDYQYDEYKHNVASIIAAGSSENGGVPYRRVVAVPVVDCQEIVTGNSTHSLLDIRCLFLAEVNEEVEEDNSYFRGQFVNECEASGDQGQQIPEISTNYTGPMEIVLYNDPDNDES